MSAGDETPRIGRGAFLAGSLIAGLQLAAGRAPTALAGSSPSADLAQFLRLSSVASGVGGLSSTLGQTYLAALEADGILKMKPSEFARLAGITAAGGPSTIAELKRSAAYKAPGGKACLDAVAAAWWSGIVPIAGGGQRVVTFHGALIWRETHEATLCQGALGSWSKPGRAVA